jgi:hypothetical protein
LFTATESRCAFGTDEATVDKRTQQREAFAMDQIEHFANFGFAAVALAFVGLGLWKMGRWLSGIIEDAILHPEKGWLAMYRAQAATWKEFLDGVAVRETNQQRLCEAHADNLKSVGGLLNDHLTISKAIHKDLEQFREDAKHPGQPYSTVKTNQKLDRISEAICHACQGAKEAVADGATPEVANVVRRKCELIENLLNQKD